LEKKEKMGLGIFLVIILLEIIVFWGTDITTIVMPKTYFTEQNIRKDIVTVMKYNKDMFLLNEKASSYMNNSYFGKLTIDSVELDGKRCNVTASSYWEGSGEVEIEYKFKILYSRENGTRWSIINFKPEANGLADGLLGSWEGNIAREEDFFNTAFNYDLEYRFERVEGDVVYGTVLAYDRLGASGDDSVAFTATWNSRNCALNVILERSITKDSLNAGDLFYDPVEGVLKSNSTVYKKSF